MSRPQKPQAATTRTAPGVTRGEPSAHHSGGLAALSKVAPAPFLRGFEGIADRRPPQPPYASRQTPAGNHQRRTPREGRLHRTR